MTNRIATAAQSHSKGLPHYTWWQVFLPDRGAWFFVYVVFGMLFMRPELLLWDGGSCRHIINGIMIDTTHKIPYSDARFGDISQHRLPHSQLAQ